MCEATYWHSDTDTFQVEINILKIVELMPPNTSAWASYFQVQSIKMRYMNLLTTPEEAELIQWKMSFKYIWYVVNIKILLFLPKFSHRT